MRISSIETILNQYLKTFKEELKNEDFMEVSGMVSVHKMPLSISMENYMIHFSFSLDEEEIEVFDKLCNFERRLKLDAELVEDNEDFKNNSFKENIKAIKEAIKTGIGRAEFGALAIKNDICKFDCIHQEKSIKEFKDGFEIYELGYNKFFFGVTTSPEDYENKFKDFKLKITNVELIDLYNIFYKLL